MKRVFLDANVVIDALAEKGERKDNALRLLSLVDIGLIAAYCSSLSLGTASYFMEKNKIKISEIIGKLNVFCGYCFPTKVDSSIVREALDSKFTDFEDGLQYFSAMTENVDIIITRNKKDFVEAKIPVYTVIQFLDIMEDEINSI